MTDLKRISILCPSRGRWFNVTRLWESLGDTTEGDWELLVRLDEDDLERTKYGVQTPDGLTSRMTTITGPRVILSQCWNDLVPYALGDIFMLCGDDITFETEGWDRLVREAFPEDGIAVVHGNDLSPNSATIGTHPFVTRRWVETLGYLAAPYFSSDYVDLWLTEVADALDRRIYLPDVVFEHRHPAFGKAEWDQTYQDRHATVKDNLEAWGATADKRAEDVAKLAACFS